MLAVGLGPQPAGKNVCKKNHEVEIMLIFIYFVTPSIIFSDRGVILLFPAANALFINDVSPRIPSVDLHLDDTQCETVELKSRMSPGRKATAT